MALMIPGPVGSLEAAVHGQGKPAGPWMVVCHPHPGFGGSMDNNVVDALVRAGAAAGCGVLTFNFRGVGESAGSFNGGQGEVDDLLAAVCYLGDEFDCPADRVIVAGYSFGAYIAAQSLAKGLTPLAALWVSPPIRMVPLPAEAVDWNGPKALFVGTRDEFCPQPDAEAACAAPDSRATFGLIQGADHFFWGHESALADRAGAFLKTLEPSAV